MRQCSKVPLNTGLREPLSNDNEYTKIMIFCICNVVNLYKTTVSIIRG